MTASSEAEGWPPSSPAITVPIDSLLPARTPRLAGEDDSHIRMLAETENELPPILVCRRSFRVIDGMHRLRAARLRGAETIKVRFVDVSDQDAFLIAVRMNVEHGLPLSLADRKAAAERVIASHAEWSDRAIAAAVGLNSKTVGALRRRSGDDTPHLNTRIGRDGQAYPVNGTDGRQRAHEVAKANPDLSVRQLAAMASVSVGTAHDVRQRLRRSVAPMPRDPVADRDGPNTVVDRTVPADQSAVQQILKRDPSLKYSEAGRALLRLLETSSLVVKECGGLVDVVPLRWSDLVADLARSYAQEWQVLAQRLDERRKHDAG